MARRWRRLPAACASGKGLGRTFTHHGPVEPLLAALAALPLLDVRIQEASLDEVFMEYYGDESR